jgi:hypothetical protein
MMKLPTSSFSKDSLLHRTSACCSKRLALLFGCDAKSKITDPVAQKEFDFYL